MGHVTTQLLSCPACACVGDECNMRVRAHAAMRHACTAHIYGMAAT